MPRKPARVIDVGRLQLCLRLNEGSSLALGPAERHAEIRDEKFYDGVDVVFG